ncbi:MAG: FHA domain-containing protein [Actinomycetota bacterium]
MQCPRCDSLVDDGAASCPTCGLVLDSEPTVAYVELPDPNHPLSPQEAASVDGITGWALIVERGPRAGMTFVLHPGEISVGRHPESDILLDDVTVSRHHCRFLCDETELAVEDSGSTNGTYVNGSRVDRLDLDPGDEVLIGRFNFLVARGDG